MRELFHQTLELQTSNQIAGAGRELQKELRAMFGASKDNHKDESQQRDEIELMRLRMLRELEYFLSKSIDRPFPRLRLLMPPTRKTKRPTISLN